MLRMAWRWLIFRVLAREEMEQIANADCNCRLIKGQVFLWEGATDWQELWT